MELTDRTVVITGASRGIGAALVRRFAAAGSRVVLAARDVDRLEELAEETGGVVHPVDLLDEAQAERFIPEVESAHGAIDVLVNNAGLDAEESCAVADVDLIRKVSRLNLEVPMVLTRQAAPGMIQRGAGHLVYLASLAGTASFPSMSHYGATKAGLLNFGGAARWELKRKGIGVTMVTPGPVDTEMWDRVEAITGSGAAVRRRFERLQLLPKADCGDLAADVVDAVRSGRRHVRCPKRLSANFWLNEAPRRIVEAALVGVRYDPTEPAN